MPRKPRRESDTEALESIANAATAAGMTYGQYQRRCLVEAMEDARQRMRDLQPVFVKTTGEYLCPNCAHQVIPHKNCGHCGKKLIWKVRV